MTSIACPVSYCDRPMPISSRVCGGCTADLTGALAAVPDLAGDLEIARARLSRMGSGGGGDGVRLPWDDRASKAIDALKNTLVGWVRVLDPVRWPADDLASIGTWLHAHRKDLLERHSAVEAVEDVTQAVRRARRVIDRPADKVYAGPCDVCGSDMYAKLGAAVVWCPTCRDDKGKLCESYNVAVRREWLLGEAQDVLGTAVEIARALTSLVHPIAPELIRTWKQRGRITQHGTDQFDRPLYRLGDVVDLMLKTPVKAG